MERNIQRIGVVNVMVLLAMAVAAQAVSSYAQSATGQVGVVYLALGFLVAAFSYFQMRLEAREQLERLEFEELAKGASESALFSREAEAFPARRAREQFERFVVPGFTVLLWLLMAGAVYGLWPWLAKAARPAVDRATVATALWALCGLVLFLLGKYGAGVARWQRQRLLQPGASYLLLGALTGFLVAVAEAAAWFRFPLVDVMVARVLTVVLGLVAVETLINLVLEIYRPRLKGQPARLLYESRLIGLLGQPGGLITTAAQALDYQFGFKVSETWFYRFLEKALAWLILLQVTVLFAFTMVVIIDPTEQGVLERFGRPVAGREVLEPGLHLKWPWPIDRVYRFNTRQVHTFFVGFVPDPELEKEKTVIWTRTHTKEEYNLLVASREPGRGTASKEEQAVPVNLLSVNIPVQYRIRDVRAWAYHHVDADKLLQNIANREVVSYLVNVDIEDLMTGERLAAAEELRRRIQAKANSQALGDLGVEVVFVGLQGIHPPVKVADAYEAVVGALQEKETNILAAQAYWAEKLPQAEAEATNLVTRAANEGFNKVSRAGAEAGQFRNQLAAYLASPSVYRQHTYLETLVRGLGPARKYVLGVTNTEEIIWLNLEDKLRADLMDLSVPSARK